MEFHLRQYAAKGLGCFGQGPDVRHDRSVTAVVYLTTGSPDLDESVEVRRWLSEVSQILYMSFARTNLYQSLHHAWMEAGLFGVLAIIIEEDDQLGFICSPLTVGEYCIACNAPAFQTLSIESFQ